MTCRRCGLSKATGVMFALCEPCFVAWNAHTTANLGDDGKYALSDAEFEYLNEGTWKLPSGEVIQVRRPN